MMSSSCAVVLEDSSALHLICSRLAIVCFVGNAVLYNLFPVALFVLLLVSLVSAPSRQMTRFVERIISLDAVTAIQTHEESFELEVSFRDSHVHVC